MSFQKAEASDGKLKGLTEIIRSAIEEPRYLRNPHQVYVNMDSDPLIKSLPCAGNPASRVELLREVSFVRANPSEIPDQVVQFCRDNLLQGPSISPAPITFGHIQSMSSLVNAVADSSSGLSRKNAEALVYDIVADVADSATKLAKQKAALAGKNLSRFQMWCYPVADSSSPFRETGETRTEAINVLGLGFCTADTELIRWSHALPVSISAHRPTAWDAGSSPGNVYWRPGGQTYRLDRDDYGVEEVVHEPIKGMHLTVAIEALS